MCTMLYCLCVYLFLCALVCRGAAGQGACAHGVLHLLFLCAGALHVGASVGHLIMHSSAPECAFCACVHHVSAYVRMSVAVRIAARVCVPFSVALRLHCSTVVCVSAHARARSDIFL